MAGRPERNLTEWVTGFWENQGPLRVGTDLTWAPIIALFLNSRVTRVKARSPHPAFLPLSSHCLR